MNRKLQPPSAPKPSASTPAAPAPAAPKAAAPKPAATAAVTPKPAAPAPAAPAPAAPAPVVSAPVAPTTASSFINNRKKLLAALLLLLLLLVLVGGGYWWFRGGKNNAIANNGGDPSRPGGRTGGDTTQRPACSDDDDPKYLEPLEFGEPVQVPFDRRYLDALDPEKHIPLLERYEWLPDQLVAVLGEHRMRGIHLAANPDGTWLTMAGAGSPFVRFGETETVHEKYILRCPAGVLTLTRSKDGTLLAVSCADGNVYVYDVRDPAAISDPVVLEKAALGGKGHIASLSFSGDKKYLIGGDTTPKTGIARVWDVQSRKIVSKLQHIGPVVGVAFSPVDGDYRALTGGGVEDGQLHLWDAIGRPNEELATIDFLPNKTDKTTWVGHVAISPDGKSGLSCHYEKNGTDNKVRVWDLTRLVKGQERGTIKTHNHRDWEYWMGHPLAAFSPDSQTVAVGRSDSGGVWICGLNGNQIKRMATTAWVHTVIFLGAGDRLAFTGSISNDHNVHIHDTASGAELKAPIWHLNRLTCVAMAPGGKYISSGASDLHVQVWNLDTVQKHLHIPAGYVVGVGYHPDGQRAYRHAHSPYTTREELVFFDVVSGVNRTPPYKEYHTHGVISADITRDGRYAVTGGYDGTVRMWRLQDGKQVRNFELPGQGNPIVSVAPDMRRAIRVGGTKTRLLQLRCQEVKHEWEPVVRAPFLPNNHAVFLGGPTAPIWRVTGDRPEQTGQFDLNLNGLTNAHISADGKRVAVILGGNRVIEGKTRGKRVGTAAIAGNQVSVYDLASAQRLWTWVTPAPFGYVSGVALSPDGSHLITGNDDGTVYVIRMP